MGRRGIVISFTLVRTVGFLLVAVGFLMPVFGGRGTGFDVANALIRSNLLMGVLMFNVFVSAIFGGVIGLLMLTSRRRKISAATGWIDLALCIASGLVVYFVGLRAPALGAGGVLILAGWIAALVGQVSRGR